MDRLVVVSLDSHAQVPTEAWPGYLEPEFHDHLPQAREDDRRHAGVMGDFILGAMLPDPSVFDHDGVFAGGGVRGMYELDTRLAQMDREGVAAELVYNGEPRQGALFFQASNRPYPNEVVEAGVRVHHRWAHDTFGPAGDRILLAGVTGHAPCLDMDATLAELRWLADHDFIGTVMPGMTVFPGQASLYDEYWEPFWSECEALGLALIVHAGYGPVQGPLSDALCRLEERKLAGATQDEMAELTVDTLRKEFFLDLLPRRPMWQLMLSGVFDRHPDLKLLLTEIRADWLPALLQHLDAMYDQHRGDLAAKRRPTEYWKTNGLTSLSFAHRAEVEMREQIGIETIGFGRDYPHPEGTWPNTKEWLQEAFAGVPEAELRLMLGENAIRFFDLDRAHLEAIAARIGPTVDQVLGAHPEIDPALLAHFDLRGGYLKPWEGDARVAEIDPLLQQDLAGMGARVPVS
jgi:predicted TIM-barrel fold metal-dependent hydrolase